MAEPEASASRTWFGVPVFAILLFQTAALIARSYLEVKLRERGYELNLASDLSFLVVPPILLLLMYPVLRKHGHLLLALLRLKDLSLRLVAISVLLGITLRLAFWGGLIAMTAFGINVDDQPLVIGGPYLSWQCPPAWPMALGILVSVLMIPVIEESIVRGFLLHHFLCRGKVFAVLVSSLLFAVFHNPQTVYLAFVVGLFFAVATLNSRALWVSTIAHAACNLMGQLDWRCLNGQWNPQDITPAMVGAGALATALLLASFLLACLLVSKRIIGPPASAR